MSRTRFEELLERLDDGTLSDPEQVELAEMLEQNPEYRKELHQRWSLSGAIAAELQEAEAAAVVRNNWADVDNKAQDSGTISRVKPVPKRHTKRSTYSGWFALAAILALAVCVAFVLRTPHSPLLTIVADDEFDGQATQFLRNGVVENTQAGITVYAGDRIEVPDGAHLELAYIGETTRIVLTERSVATFSRASDGAKEIQLDKGSLNAVVAKQSRALKINTPHANAAVLGTTLKVDVGSPNTRLEVTEGAVKLENSDTPSVVVHAGEYGVAQSGAKLMVSPLVDVTLDNISATVKGEWTSSRYQPGYYGANYLHDRNSGKGNKSVRYSTGLRPGRFQVFMRWTTGGSRATKVPVNIEHANGTATVFVNEQLQNATWVSLGTYTFNTSGAVEIRTTDTTGHVIADAVRFLAQE